MTQAIMTTFFYFYFHLSYTCKFYETCDVGDFALTLMFHYFWPRNNIVIVLDFSGLNSLWYLKMSFTA